MYIDGFLGASPDSVVQDNSGHVVKLVEVECPHKARDKHIEELLDDTSFCCCRQNNRISLKTNHDYYYQVQGQMSISGIQHILIDFDETFWNSYCYPRSKSFLFVLYVT